MRTKRGSADAIFLARRLDLTLADQNGTLVMLSLDWEKAFDSISPDGLLYALERFGLPPLTGLSQSARLVIHRLHILSALAFRKDACFHHSSFSILTTVLFTDASPVFQSVSGLDSPPALVNDLMAERRTHQEQNVIGLPWPCDLLAV